MSVVEINNYTLNIEIARTPKELERGLSGRENLAENQGMLFVFNKSDRHAIWMKDMKFPIDIIWVGEDLKIVDILANITPDTFPQTFLPRTPALYVLEVNAGWTAQHNIVVGASVSLDHSKNMKN